MCFALILIMLIIIDVIYCFILINAVDFIDELLYEYLIVVIFVTIYQPITITVQLLHHNIKINFIIHKEKYNNSYLLLTIINYYLQLLTIISATLDLRQSWEKDNLEEKRKLSILAEEIKNTWESEIQVQENTLLRITELEKLREKEKLEAHASVLQLSVENRRLQDLLQGEYRNRFFYCFLHLVFVAFFLLALPSIPSHSSSSPFFSPLYVNLLLSFLCRRFSSFITTHPLFFRFFHFLHFPFNSSFLPQYFML